jgi:nucleotide-binding universal stress UspA family protein
MTAPAVVVGIKGTGNSRAALRLAAQEARYRDATLIAVTAYGGTASVLPGATSQYVLRKAPCPILIVPDEETA